MKKKLNQKTILGAGVLIIAIGAFLFFFIEDPKKSSDNNVDNNSVAVQETGENDKEKESNSNATVKAGIYENKKAGISFTYPESYKVTKDNLGSGEINSKLILNDESRKLSVTIYQNLHGLNPQFSDYIYHMVKSGDSFVISKRVEGEIPERDTESFSIIANFGDAEGTSKVNGSSMIMIFNSTPNNTFEDEFKKIVLSLKEVK
ncbi:hypothetical protein HGB13_03430 [bacterium]|nr:hypothetical protein [bacterium]